MLDDTAALEASSYPLIVYVHVPKTAGNTVKRFLHCCTPRGHHNAHFVINNDAAFVNLARRSDWIAGHVSRDRLARGLIWLDRPIEYFSSVREPIAQIVSHLNWSFEKYRRSNYYGVIDREEQQLDADVMSTDFTNPAAAVSLLLRHRDVYLNNQSAYVLGADFTEISDDEVARRLATYTYVTSEHDLPNLYQAFGFAAFPPDASEIRENVAKSCINASVFESPQMREFIAHHNRHDLRLYTAIRAASWPSKARRPYRPAFLGLREFTPENFDEQAYLDSNPDIANAVVVKRFDSGRAHFERYGYKESRMMRRWVLPPEGISGQSPAAPDFSASSVLARLRNLREECVQIAEELKLR